MSVLRRIVYKTPINNTFKTIVYYCNKAEKPEYEDKEDDGEFRVLTLRTSIKSTRDRAAFKKHEISAPRHKTMPVDQDWGSVWPGPRSFHPATVPLPLRQGYAPKGAPPTKYANAELMKIPNFLHLTPPVVKRQCEALKQFCTPWPKAISTEEKFQEYFPLEITSSDYCLSSPTIRVPLARIVTLRVKMSTFKFDERAKDKFLRLVGDRYDEKTDSVTIVTDRCPLKQQNYDYAMYLITALYHESWNVEPWEQLKSEADMEYYEWSRNASKQSIEQIFNKPAEEIPHSENYGKNVSALMNEGESEYTLKNYSDAARKLLNLATL